MWIFNCTEAASVFFSRVQKEKKITPVVKPPSSIIEDDVPDETAEQWLVHAAIVQRKHVLYVIHVKTRYCMIFAGAKKADVEGFVKRFSERWINGVIHHARQHDILRWFNDELIIERFQESCRESVFYKRGHRGAQKHINDIAWVFEGVVAERGSLPPNELSAAGFDGEMNNYLKSGKGNTDCFYPNEEMITHWLRCYGGLDEPGIQAARDRHKDAKREIREFVRQLQQAQEPVQ